MMLKSARKYIFCLMKRGISDHVPDILLVQARGKCKSNVNGEHDRTENACTVSTSLCPIQSLRKLF